MVNFTIRNESGYSCLKVLRNRFDTLISPEIKAQLVLLSNGGARNIIMDLEDCEYCDSSGLGAILVGNRLCEGTEGTFILCNLSVGVEKIIKLAMLDTILLITSGFKEAEELLIKKTEL